mgnify:CR=1 FL=1
MRRLAENHARLVQSRTWRVLRMLLSACAWIVMALAALVLVSGGMQ